MIEEEEVKTKEQHYELMFLLFNDENLGWLADPYAVLTDEDGEHSYDCHRLYPNTVSDYDIEMTDWHKEIFEYWSATTIAQLEQKFVVKGRGKPKTLEQVLLDKTLKLQVRDFLDRKLARMLEMIHDYTLEEGNLQRDRRFPQNLLFLQEKRSDKFTKNPLTMATSRLDAVFKFERTGDEILYTLTPKTGGKEVNLMQKQVYVITAEPGWIIIGNKLLRTAGSLTGKNFLPFLKTEVITIPKRLEKDYFKKFILKTMKSSQVEAEGFEVAEQSAKPIPVLKMGENFLQNSPAMILTFRYGDQEFYCHDKRESHIRMVVSDNDDIKVQKTLRDMKWENEQQEKLTNIGMEYLGEGFWQPALD
ncbi:MAG: hypothetical protein WD077_04300 [Bacteroidia bacterium]